MKRVRTKIIIGLLALVSALGLSNAASAADGNNYYTIEINNGIDFLADFSMADSIILVQGVFRSNDSITPEGLFRYNDQAIFRVDMSTGRIIVDEDRTVELPMDPESAIPDLFDYLNLSPDYDGVRISAKKEPKQQQLSSSNHVINLYDKSDLYKDFSIIDMSVLGLSFGSGYYNYANGLKDNLARCPSDSNYVACALDGRPLVLSEPSSNGRYYNLRVSDEATAKDNIHYVLTEDDKVAIRAEVQHDTILPSSYLDNLSSITINFVEPPHEEQSNEAPAAETVSVPLPATFDDVLAYVITFAGSVSALTILVLVCKKKTSKI